MFIAGAVVGAPGAGALTSFTSCQSNKAEQFVEATVAATTDLGLNNGIALSEVRPANSMCGCVQ